MTTLYLDTEFNGFGGELLSMALVVERPSDIHWYGYRDFRSLDEAIDPWVAENVVPQLGWGTFAPFRSLREMKNSFWAFIASYDSPEIICDWNEDAVHFCRMLQGEDYASSHDFAVRLTVLKTPPGQPVSNSPHNALEDAWALRDWHQRVSGRDAA
jgi:hypothetical protein